MKDIERMRQDLAAMMRELHASMREIGENALPQAAVVNNARDRLRYISALTEQAAGQTLSACERILPTLHAQQAIAAELMGKTRSPEIRAFLARLQDEHAATCQAVSEIIQAQSFQDLVGQVINKLTLTVQKMEDSLAHLLIEEEPDGPLAGPAVRESDRVSQADIDDLFDSQ